MTETIGPIAPRDRIAVLDVLRGLAMLLILLMNIPYMGNLSDVAERVIGWTPADQAAWWFQRVLLGGTQRGMLELLFGAGMLIMAKRAMHPDGPVAVADAYYRRNLWLAVFGLAHGFLFLWYGEILFLYGVAALMIFQFRTLAPRTLLLSGLAVLLLMNGVFGYKHTAERRALLHDAPAALALETAHKPLTDEQAATVKQWHAIEEHQTGRGKAIARERAAHFGSLLDYAKWAGGLWIDYYGDLPLWVFEAAGTMLIGAALYKWEIIQGGRSARFYLWMMLGCYALAVPLRIMEAREIAAFTLDPKLYWYSYQPARLLMTLGHLALINLAVMSAAGRRLLHPIEACGRIPLSVYFGQSIIGMWILFPGFGLGLFGKFGWYDLTLIALAIIAVQIVLANLWLRWFENGPFEWLWKSLAYVERQPFRKPQQVAVAAE